MDGAGEGVMLQNIAAAVLQILLLICLAPLLQGLIKKVKARLQNRIGPPLLQSYYEIWKDFNKQTVISEHASWLTRCTPYITWSCLVTAGLMVPSFFLDSPLGFIGDVLMVVYLFGMARIFTALAALDSGSAFGGMGSSREMAIGAIIEPALLFAVVGVCLVGKTTVISQLSLRVAEQSWDFIDPAYGLAVLAMLIVVMAETGRIPVDNPDTHLELTMIHEAMLLEYSGRYLGLMMWAAEVKQLVVLNIFISLFFPWGIAAELSSAGIVWAALLYLLKLALLAVVLAVIETMYAKVRLFKVPPLLASSMALSVLVIILRVVM